MAHLDVEEDADDNNNLALNEILKLIKLIKLLTQNQGLLLRYKNGCKNNINRK